MKKIFVTVAVAFFSTMLFSQGFSTFIVEGALQPASIKNVSGENASTIEAIVSNKVDISNVNFKYRLLSGCTVSPAIGKDFSKEQNVVVNKNDGSSKDWNISVKQLKPAQLPLELNFSDANPSYWDNNVEGWAGVGIDASKPSVIRFGNKGVSFWVAFDASAKYVSYQLKVVSKSQVAFDGEFYVETSVDGLKWKTLKAFNESNQISSDGNYRHELKEDVRYIRWTYESRNKLNLNLNNIVVSNE